MKKLLALVLALVMLLALTIPAGAAEAYEDMPQGWSHDAVAAAVENGLLQGSEGRLDPAGYLTRAQAATILVRALGGTAKADISGYTDVSKDAWYYDELSTAVAMGLFSGNAGKLNPNDRITREQTALVLSRALWLTDTGADLTGYADAGSISSWAKDGVDAMVKAGYLEGSGKNLNPGAYITREEFAQMLYNIVAKYDGETGASVDGNLVLRAKNVTLSGAKISGDLIVGDGVGDSTVTIKDSTIGGRLVIRGGGKDSVVVTNTKLTQVVAARPDGPVHFSADAASKPETVYAVGGSGQVILSGSIGAVVVNTATPVLLDKATVDRVTVNTAKAAVVVAAGSSVTDAAIAKGADNVTLTVSGTGTVSNVTTDAGHATITGDGTVKAVVAGADSEGTTVKTPKTAITNNSDGAVSTGSGEVAAGKSETTNSSGGVETPSGGGGGGGSTHYTLTITVSRPGDPEDVSVSNSKSSVIESAKFYDQAASLLTSEKRSEIKTKFADDTELLGIILDGYVAFYNQSDNNASWNTFVTDHIDSTETQHLSAAAITAFQNKDVTLKALKTVSGTFAQDLTTAKHTYTVTVTIS